MTGSDLIRLATELDECGGMHRLTSLINCAVKRCMEHERASWPPMLRAEPDDSETGVGMSDKVARQASMREEPGEFDALMAARYGARRAPGREEASGGICCGGVVVRGVATAFSPGLAHVSPDPTASPAPLTTINGERQPLPRGGISHDQGSPILRDFGNAQSDFGRRYERCVPRRKPINPEDLGDGA